MDTAYHYRITERDGQKFTDEKYPIIIFNDIQLPLGAIFIDFCASTTFFENIDKKLSKWFWKFTICVGLHCSEKSETVLKYSAELKSLLINNKRHVIRLIYEKYHQPEADNIFKWWNDTLDIMIETAKCDDICKWHGVPNRL